MAESHSENNSSETPKVEISISPFGTNLHKAIEYEDEWEEPIPEVIKRRKTTNQIKDPKTSKDINDNSSDYTESHPSGLSALQLQYLKAVAKTPGKPCSQYNEFVSCRKDAAIAIRHGLVEEGWLCEEESKTKKLGRTMKRVFPLKKTEELFPEIFGKEEK